MFKTFSQALFLLGVGIFELAAPTLAQNKFSAPSGWVPQSIAYLKASNTTHDFQFGYSVALSGDGNTVVVGSVNESSGAKGINGNQADQSMLDSGAVYVYTRRNGKWTQQAFVKASNPKKGANFGNSVALSNDGNTLAVGAYLEDSSATGFDGNQNDDSVYAAGAVYVFTRRSTVWSQQAYIKASNPHEGDQFGYSVALNGDGSTLAVGAITEPSKARGVNGDQSDASAPGTGAAYIYARTGATWSQQAYLKPNQGEPTGVAFAGALFGYGIGLSTDGNTVAVGAENEYNAGGAVYVFVRNGINWSEQAHLKAVNEENGDSLGWCLAISGDGNTIVAGANDEDSLLVGVQRDPNSGAHDRERDTSTGAAYVFTRGTDAKWSQQVWLKSINTRKNDKYASSIAISRDGKTIAVGSIFGAGPGGSNGVNADPNDDSNSGSGSVYVYTRTGDVWASAAYVKAPNARPSAEFGNSVALSADGKTLAAGSFRETSSAKGIKGNEADSSAPAAGAAYVFY
jgi:hypothetical protein